jgi:hypothetical protein
VFGAESGEVGTAAADVAQQKSKRPIARFFAAFAMVLPLNFANGLGGSRNFGSVSVLSCMR